MDFKIGDKYKIKSPGATGIGVYQSCFFNKEIGEWIFIFVVSLGQYFAVESKYVTEIKKIVKRKIKASK